MPWDGKIKRCLDNNEYKGAINRCQGEAIKAKPCTQPPLTDCTNCYWGCQEPVGAVWVTISGVAKYLQCIACTDPIAWCGVSFENTENVEVNGTFLIPVAPIFDTCAGRINLPGTILVKSWATNDCSFHVLNQYSIFASIEVACNRGGSGWGVGITFRVVDDDSLFRRTHTAEFLDLNRKCVKNTNASFYAQFIDICGEDGTGHSESCAYAFYGGSATVTW